MRRFTALASILFLTACGASGTVSMTDPAKAAFAARSAYAVALTAANQYAALPRCGQATSPVVCSQQSVVVAMRQASTAADAATLNGEHAVRSLGANPTVVQAAVVAAEASVKSLQQINATYGGK